ncbi:hypothetical protein DNTS_025260, partial [Danionella cerebrum]
MKLLLYSDDKCLEVVFVQLHLERKCWCSDDGQSRSTVDGCVWLLRGQTSKTPCSDRGMEVLLAAGGGLTALRSSVELLISAAGSLPPGVTSRPDLLSGVAAACLGTSSLSEASTRSSLNEEQSFRDTRLEFEELQNVSFSLCVPEKELSSPGSSGFTAELLRVKATPDGEHPSTLPQGTVNMNLCTDVIDAEPRTGQKNALCIVTPEQEYYIRGDNKEIINGWTEQLVVYPRTNKQNQKKKRKVEPATSQEPGPAKVAVTGSGIPDAPDPESPLDSSSLIWQEEIQSREAEAAQRIQLQQPPLGSPAPPAGDCGALGRGWDRSSMNGEDSDRACLSAPLQTPGEHLWSAVDSGGVPRCISPAPSDPFPSGSSLVSNGSHISGSLSSLDSDASACNESLGGRGSAGRRTERHGRHSQRERESVFSPERSPERPEREALLSPERRVEVALDLEQQERMELEESSPAREGRSHTRRLYTEVQSQTGQRMDAGLDFHHSALPPLRRAKSLDRRTTESVMTPDLLNFKKGWMVKLDDQGQWKKFWFVLTDHSLRYYKDSIAEEASDLDGEIDLSSCYNVTEYQAQRNYGFQIHTQEAVHTLSAMTAGIRRNWIQAVMKNVRPSTAPDVARSDAMTLPVTLRRSQSLTQSPCAPFTPSLADEHSSCSVFESLVRPDVTQDSPCSEASVEREVGAKKSRARERRREGRSKTFDWAEFRPIAQALAQQRAAEAHSAQADVFERGKRREERRRRYESVTTSSFSDITDAINPEECALLPPEFLTGAHQQRVEEEIEQRWQQVEQTPIREERRVPLPSTDHSGAAEETRALMERYRRGMEDLQAQLESCHQQLQDSDRRRQDLESQLRSALEREQQIRPGYISPVPNTQATLLRLCRAGLHTCGARAGPSDYRLPRFFVLSLKYPPQDGSFYYDLFRIEKGGSKVWLELIIMSPSLQEVAPGNNEERSIHMNPERVSLLDSPQSDESELQMKRSEPVSSQAQTLTKKYQETKEILQQQEQRKRLMQEQLGLALSPCSSPHAAAATTASAAAASDSALRTLRLTLQDREGAVEELQSLVDARPPLTLRELVRLVQVAECSSAQGRSELATGSGKESPRLHESLGNPQDVESYRPPLEEFQGRVLPERRNREVEILANENQALKQRFQEIVNQLREADREIERLKLERRRLRSDKEQEDRSICGQELSEKLLDALQELDVLQKSLRDTERRLQLREATLRGLGFQVTETETDDGATDAEALRNRLRDLQKSLSEKEMLLCSQSAQHEEDISALHKRLAEVQEELAHWRQKLDDAESGREHRESMQDQVENVQEEFRSRLEALDKVFAAMLHAGERKPEGEVVMMEKSQAGLKEMIELRILSRVLGGLEEGERMRGVVERLLVEKKMLHLMRKLSNIQDLHSVKESALKCAWMFEEETHACIMKDLAALLQKKAAVFSQTASHLRANQELRALALSLSSDAPQRTSAEVIREAVSEITSMYHEHLLMFLEASRGSDDAAERPPIHTGGESVEKLIQLQGAEARHETELRALRDLYDQQEEKLKEELAKARDTLKRRGEENVKEIDSLTQCMANLKSRHQAERHEFQRAMEEIWDALGHAEEDGVPSVSSIKIRIQKLVEKTQRLEGNEESRRLRLKYESDLEKIKATCERGFAAMEESHQKVIEELQRKHQTELEKLTEEKERLLAEETAATISAIEAMKNAHRSELERELEKARKTTSGSESADVLEIHQQHECVSFTLTLHSFRSPPGFVISVMLLLLLREELVSFQREIEVLSEQYSQKCLENAHLSQALEAERQALRQCQRENQELNAHNQELNNRLAAEITKMRSMACEDGADAGVAQGKELYELEGKQDPIPISARGPPPNVKVPGKHCGRFFTSESSLFPQVMLRVKESEVQYLKQEINSLKDELQAAQRDKKYATDKYKDIYTELSIVRAKAERDLSRLREQLQSAHDALGQEGEEAERSGYDIMKSKSNPDILKMAAKRSERSMRSKYRDPGALSVHHPAARLKDDRSWHLMLHQTETQKLPSHADRTARGSGDVNKSEGGPDAGAEASSLRQGHKGFLRPRLHSQLCLQRFHTPMADPPALDLTSGSSEDHLTTQLAPSWLLGPGVDTGLLLSQVDPSSGPSLPLPQNISNPELLDPDQALGDLCRSSVPALYGIPAPILRSCELQKLNTDPTETQQMSLAPLSLLTPAELLENMASLCFLPTPIQLQNLPLELLRSLRSNQSSVNGSTGALWSIGPLPGAFQEEPGFSAAAVDGASNPELVFLITGSSGEVLDPQGLTLSLNPEQIAAFGMALDPVPVRDCGVPEHEGFPDGEPVDVVLNEQQMQDGTAGPNEKMGTHVFGYPQTAVPPNGDAANREQLISEDGSDRHGLCLADEQVLNDLNASQSSQTADVHAAPLVKQEASACSPRSEAARISTPDHLRLHHDPSSQVGDGILANGEQVVLFTASEETVSGVVVEEDDLMNATGFPETARSPEEQAEQGDAFRLQHHSSAPEMKERLHPLHHDAVSSNGDAFNSIHQDELLKVFGFPADASFTRGDAALREEPVEALPENLFGLIRSSASQNGAEQEEEALNKSVLLSVEGSDAKRHLETMFRLFCRSQTALSFMNREVLYNQPLHTRPENNATAPLEDAKHGLGLTPNAPSLNGAIDAPQQETNNPCSPLKPKCFENQDFRPQQSSCSPEAPEMDAQEYGSSFPNLAAGEAEKPDCTLVTEESSSDGPGEGPQSVQNSSGPLGNAPVRKTLPLRAGRGLRMESIVFNMLPIRSKCSRASGKEACRRSPQKTQSRLKGFSRRGEKTPAFVQPQSPGSRRSGSTASLSKTRHSSPPPNHQKPALARPAKKPPAARRKNPRPKASPASILAPQEPQINLRCLERWKRRKERRQPFAPYVRLHHNDYPRCTLVNYPESGVGRPSESDSGSLPDSPGLSFSRICMDATTRSALVCCFCAESANAMDLGDLHGPYLPEGFRHEAKGEMKPPEEEQEVPLREEWSSDGGDGASRWSRDRNKREQSWRASSEEGSRACRNHMRVWRSSDWDAAIDWSSPPVLPIGEREFWFHENCAVWAAGVVLVRGKLYGLESAVEMAKALVCWSCGRAGATLSCVFKGCSHSYHYRCALLSGERERERERESFMYCCRRASCRSRERLVTITKQENEDLLPREMFSEDICSKAFLSSAHSCSGAWTDADRTRTAQGFIASAGDQRRPPERNRRVAERGQCSSDELLLMEGIETFPPNCLIIIKLLNQSLCLALCGLLASLLGVLWSPVLWGSSQLLQNTPGTRAYKMILESPCGALGSFIQTGASASPALGALNSFKQRSGVYFMFSPESLQLYVKEPPPVVRRSHTSCEEMMRAANQRSLREVAETQWSQMKKNSKDNGDEEDADNGSGDHGIVEQSCVMLPPEFHTGLSRTYSIETPRGNLTCKLESAKGNLPQVLLSLFTQ